MRFAHRAVDFEALLAGPACQDRLAALDSLGGPVATEQGSATAAVAAVGAAVVAALGTYA